MLVKKVLKDTACQEALNYPRCTGGRDGRQSFTGRSTGLKKETSGTCALYGTNEPYGPEKSNFLQPVA